MNDNNYLEFENFNQDFINKWNNIDNKLKYQKKLYKNKKNINNLSIISLNLNNLIHQIDNNCEKYFQSKINELNLLKSNSNNIKIKNNNKPFIKEKNKKTQKYDSKKTFLKFNNESEQNDKKSIDEILIEQKEENIKKKEKIFGIRNLIEPDFNQNIINNKNEKINVKYLVKNKDEKIENLIEKLTKIKDNNVKDNNNNNKSFLKREDEVQNNLKQIKKNKSDLFNELKLKEIQKQYNKKNENKVYNKIKDNYKYLYQLYPKLINNQ